MQRWVLERGGIVRDYLLTAGEPSDAQKRVAVFGAAAPVSGGMPNNAVGNTSIIGDERDLAAEGAWRRVTTAQLVSTGWTFAGGVYAMPAPPPAPRTISAVAFLARFTSAEQAALYAADAMLIAGAIKVATQGTANLDSADAAGLMALGVARGVLTANRAAEILA